MTMSLGLIWNAARRSSSLIVLLLVVPDAPRAVCISVEHCYTMRNTAFSAAVSNSTIHAGAGQGRSGVDPEVGHCTAMLAATGMPLAPPTGWSQCQYRVLFAGNMPRLSARLRMLAQHTQPALRSFFSTVQGLRSMRAKTRSKPGFGLCNACARWHGAPVVPLVPC